VTTQAHLYKQDDALKVPAKTGWPAPELAQDDHRPLFKWFASRLDARRRVREACEAIRARKDQK
jgi:hypothetical protein